MSDVKEKATTITQRPVVAHLLRAFKRFGTRLGNQFGAAITYFSILAIVPIVMFAFSVLGFILVVVDPSAMEQLMDQIRSATAGMDHDTREKLVDTIGDSMRHWAAIGIVGLLSAMYSGAGWMGNLKNAVRAQWRPNFDLSARKQNFIIKTLTNFAILIGFLVMVVVTFALASVATALADNIVAWLGLEHLVWLTPVLRILPILVSIATGWLLFMYLYLVLPETKESGWAVRRGALIGAIGLAVLQYLTSFLMAKFSANPAAAVFGPVIVLMLFFNLFARLILFVAAWIGTAEHDVVEAVDEAEGSTGQTAAETADNATADWRGPWSSAPEGMVPQQVAVRSVRAGTRTGYLTGAATGAGMGAVLAYLMNKRPRRRR